jgi:hypothetical protein
MARNQTSQDLQMAMDWIPLEWIPLEFGFPIQQDASSLLHAPDFVKSTLQMDFPSFVSDHEIAENSKVVVAAMQENVMSGLQIMIKAYHQDRCEKITTLHETSGFSSYASNVVQLQRDEIAQFQNVKRPPGYACDSEYQKYIYTCMDADVLMGRGGTARHHPGNRMYLAAKEGLQEKYRRTSSLVEKCKISRGLVESVHARGGRFLQKVSNGIYVEVGSARARAKASQALREVRGIKKRERQIQSITSMSG